MNSPDHELPSHFHYQTIIIPSSVEDGDGIFASARIVGKSLQGGGGCGMSGADSAVLSMWAVLLCCWE